MTLQVETRTAIERARDQYPRARSAILPALWAVQHEQGLITADAMSEIAAILHVTPSDVEAVSTFYSMYFQHPHGRHEVIVCINVSCALRGAEGIVDHLERTLGCASGETTADGAFTWSSTVECLGGCGGAPTMQVDHHFQENLTPDRVDEILGALRSSDNLGGAGPVAAGTPRRRASGGSALPPAAPPASPSASTTGAAAEASPDEGSVGETPLTTPKEPEQAATTGPGLKKRTQRRGKAAQ
jgi:NADH-quinone oxidoreductase subunit E